jgi:TPR repeat protein
VCLLEGIPHLADFDTVGGVHWLRKAEEAGNTQGLYELGILYYTGSAEPVIEEDESKAFQYLEKTALVDHTSGLYMVAMMMMKEQGCSQDLPRSIDLLYRAGERGHRTARATLLTILEEYQ